MLFFRNVISFLLAVSQLAFSSTPTINEPANGTTINPGADFDFSYQSIADYETSSYNYTVWLYTSPPQGFSPSINYASGYYFGQYSEPNYPGNPNPPNRAPKRLNMPNFATLERGFGTGSHAHNATFYLTVLEEYATNGSLGYRISLAYNIVSYNGT
ncbi:hypothetical protein HYPSUDRAFT_136780 [Hypholoma sublateritium FD-334 SS-4]|uniref:Uncharacterized protein n=1 Tax=Hypholoma sublateritium (strain FD-334 SS-4) TaxID=945553 RepID=A0A0D2NZ53_HYPSF|nr:hypothetical protein HYPSUDRAFT_136780 [Hypholoma sublateritium FD-334 SS-4]